MRGNNVSARRQGTRSSIFESRNKNEVQGKHVEETHDMAVDGALKPKTRRTEIRDSFTGENWMRL
jgi:hypothetical protein